MLQNEINVIAINHKFFINSNINVAINIDSTLAQAIPVSDLLLKKCTSWTVLTWR
ncbi:hypothetical protein BN439_2047 [Erwinia amylovora Ea644]|nr:hypothetical protein BN439_2047 [Erwinia amylovora Ea644]CCP07104.1 hypothetical protein BN440_2078 [Erwinia amylovora MR1]